MKFRSMTAIFAIALACVAASANEPATRPDISATTRPANIPFLQWHRALRAFAGRTAGIRPYTQQEWDDMMDFMQTNAPTRWHILATLPLAPNAPVRLDAMRKWRNYVFTRDHFPDVADQLLKRFRLEDDLFALTLDAQSSGEVDSASIRDRIRSKIAEIVQLDFSERQTRIDKLEKMLDEEKSRLAADQASFDKIINQRTDQIMTRLDRLSRETAPTTRPMTEEADENAA